MRKGQVKVQTIEEIKKRFNQKVKISKAGCHEWVGTVQSNGEFTVIGEVMNKHGGFSGKNRIITASDYTEVKTHDTAI